MLMSVLHLDAKVRNFSELCKFFSDYFSKKCEIGGSFSLFQFFTFDICIFADCQTRNFIIIYYI